MNMVREDQKRAVNSDNNTWMYIMQESSAFLVVMLNSRISLHTRIGAGSHCISYDIRMKHLLISSEGAHCSEGEPESLFMISYSN